MNTIADFKNMMNELTSEIDQVKTITKSLTNNLYTSFNQMNFSIKVIVQFYAFINKYVYSSNNISQVLNNALITEQDDENINFSLYELIGFNESLITDYLRLDTFSKILVQAISDHLIKEKEVTTKKSLEEIYEYYCESTHIKNDWPTAKIIARNIVNKIGNLFNIELVNPDKSKPLYTEFTNYKTIITTLTTLFNLSTDVTNTNTEIDLEDTLDLVKEIINFKTTSPIYKGYLISLDNAIQKAYDLFDKLVTAIGELVDGASVYEVNFKDSNDNIQTLLDAAQISQDLLSTLKIKYPTVDSLENLFTDESFNKVLSSIENIYVRELNNLDRLLYRAVADYKLIKSIETFMYKSPTIRNNTIYQIMNTFDKELQMLEDISTDEKTLTFVPIKYFNEDNKVLGESFGKQSFNYKLQQLNLLTEPYYDAFNYYRMFLYKMKNDKKYIFDMLETFRVFNIDITNTNFNDYMEDFFSVRINKIDYLNIDEAKLNPSITSRYPSLKTLDLFAIERYIEALSEINLEEIEDYDDLFDYFNDQVNFNFIHFDITKKLLYDNIDLEVLFEYLKKRTSYKDSFYMILFNIIMDYTIKLIETTYTNNNTDELDIPIGEAKYDELTRSLLDFSVITDEIEYINNLFGIKKIYEGEEDNPIFNLDMIENFDNPDESIWVDDPETIDSLKDLFSSFLLEV